MASCTARSASIETSPVPRIHNKCRYDNSDPKSSNLFTRTKDVFVSATVSPFRLWLISTS